MICEERAQNFAEAGDDLEQIQLVLGHASIEATERYLGTEQVLAHAVNDAIGLNM